jgi:hypothetical protein
MARLVVRVRCEVDAFSCAGHLRLRMTPDKRSRWLARGHAEDEASLKKKKNNDAQAPQRNYT